MIKNRQGVVLAGFCMHKRNAVLVIHGIPLEKGED
jgi:hypothetical protein